jgi:2,4-dienoyl-CoA reductase-like NADH-dependent reductase (Old Yellow Enzyme family)
VLGGLQLRNRVVMASMTRGRARNAELAPTELHVEYYRQRAAAGRRPTTGADRRDTSTTPPLPEAKTGILKATQLTKAQRRASLQISTGRQLWK